MFYVPGSPMNEDEVSYHTANQDIDEDMHSHSTGRDSADMDEDEEATGQRGDTDEVGENEPVVQLNGEEDSDDEADEDASSELEDERSEFGYGDLEEHVIEGEDDDEDNSDDDSEIDLGAEDGEGAADNEEDYDDYGEYFVAASNLAGLVMPGATPARPVAIFRSLRQAYGICRGLYYLELASWTAANVQASNSYSNLKESLCILTLESNYYGYELIRFALAQRTFFGGWPNFDQSKSWTLPERDWLVQITS
ncbi:uncharacterized protein HD556DRAFT_1304534 [Suillus plorans]|uniref:Uncharacterized protein n=1 Tax=Suillus plorans TaxID=116603 RepID=A0A9P7J3V2_9AGAM|nr:uncharacterized protein HD556DRAFT_1304534 [Suillus plorans]KAG1801427.1 hypothetical protein HD556DRAFT_1304534 [Suillus plorans]